MRITLTCLMILCVTPCWAHDFYDSSCCSGKDCRPVEDSEVKELRYGWSTPMGIINYLDRRVKPSKDGRYHLCTGYRATIPPRAGDELPLAMRPFLRCLYVPPRGL